MPSPTASCKQGMGTTTPPSGRLLPIGRHPTPDANNVRLLVHVALKSIYPSRRKSRSKISSKVAPHSECHQRPFIISISESNNESRFQGYWTREAQLPCMELDCLEKFVFHVHPPVRLKTRTGASFSVPLFRKKTDYPATEYLSAI